MKQLFATLLVISLLSPLALATSTVKQKVVTPLDGVSYKFKRFGEELNNVILKLPVIGSSKARVKAFVSQRIERMRELTALRAKLPVKRAKLEGKSELMFADPVDPAIIDAISEVQEAARFEEGNVETELPSVVVETKASLETSDDMALAGEVADEKAAISQDKATLLEVKDLVPSEAQAGVARAIEEEQQNGADLDSQVSTAGIAAQVGVETVAVAGDMQAVVTDAQAGVESSGEGSGGEASG